MSEFDFWTWFTIATFGGFGLWEFAAIAKGRRDWTFTYKIRQWLGIEPVRPWRVPASIAFALAMIVFTGWFIPHIVFGWWGGAP
jgi:hypothetical protein